MKSKLTVRDMTLIAMAIALITVCAWIQVPAVVPFTLQTFAVFTVVGLLGMKRGVISVAAYVLLGAVGVPVFSKFNSGLGYILGNTGGYIIGFIFTAWVTGFIIRLLGKKVWSLALGMTAGLLVCYLFGTAWFFVVYTQNKGPVELSQILMWCVIPFLPADAVKIVLASVIVNRVSKYIPAD